MNTLKALLVGSAVTICCLGNDYPAKAYGMTCYNIGGMTQCTDSSGNTGTRYNFGSGIEMDNYYINGQSVNCTTYNIGGMYSRQCY